MVSPMLSAARILQAAREEIRAQRSVPTCGASLPHPRSRLEQVRECKGEAGCWQGGNIPTGKWRDGEEEGHRGVLEGAIEECEPSHDGKHKTHTNSSCGAVQL